MLKLLLTLLVSSTFGTEPFEVTADEMTASQKSGVYIATGNVVLRRKGQTAYADIMTFDENTQLVTARGNVTLVEAAAVTTCNQAVFHVNELRGGLVQAKLRLKKGLAPETLLNTAKDKLDTIGKNDVTVTAARLSVTGRETFNVSNADFTPCHCDKESPSWSIKTSSASVAVNEGAWLRWPIFYIKQVPILALPAFYLPMGDRRSGLLVPRVQHTSVTGWRVEQPLYFTLGQSWDTTLGGRYFFDRGFSPTLELRWAPSRSSNGWMIVSTLFDRGIFDSESLSWSPTAEESIFRHSVAALHRQQWGKHRLGVSINATGDPSYISEFAEQFLTRQTEFTTSRVTYSSQPTEHFYTATGLNLTQDLRAHRYRDMGELRTINLFSGARSPNEVGGPGNIRYRFFDFRADALPVPVWERGIFILGDAVARAQAFAAPWPNRPRFARVDLRPSLTFSSPSTRYFAFDSKVIGRMTSWTGRHMSETINANRFALIFRSELETELSRPISSLGLIHRIQPKLQHLYIPPLIERARGVLDTQDEIDLLAAAHQVAGVIYTDLRNAKTGNRHAYFEAGIGQNLLSNNASTTGLSPLTLKGGLSWNLSDLLSFASSAAAYVNVEEAKIEELLASARLNVGPYFSTTAAWLDVADSVSRRLFVAPEELIPSATMSTSEFLPRSEFIGQLDQGNLDVAPWTSYQGLLASLSIRPTDALAITGGLVWDVSRDEEEDAFFDKFQQLSGSIAYQSSCDCWSASLVVVKARDREIPDVRLLLDLAKLGGMSY